VRCRPVPLLLAALLLVAGTGCSDVDTTVGLAIEASRAREAEAAGAVGSDAFATLGGVGQLVVPERRAPRPGDEQAVADAVRLALDPTVAFEVAAPHLAAPAEVEASRRTFAALVAGLGGFRIAVGDVAVREGGARFVVDVYAGGRPVLVGLGGEAGEHDGRWQLTTATFCGALASVPMLVCP